MMHRNQPRQHFRLSHTVIAGLVLAVCFGGAALAAQDDTEDRLHVYEKTPFSSASAEKRVHTFVVETGDVRIPFSFPQETQLQLYQHIDSAFTIVHQALPDPAATEIQNGYTFSAKLVSVEDHNAYAHLLEKRQKEVEFLGEMIHPIHAVYREKIATVGMRYTAVTLAPYTVEIYPIQPNLYLEIHYSVQDPTYAGYAEVISTALESALGPIVLHNNIHS